MTKTDYGQFTHEHWQKISPGIALFNQQKYWECHEVLEDLWKEDTQDNARLVYWAVIQVAASLIHYRQDKLIGAAGMIKKAKEKFQKAEKLNVETQILYDKLSWKKLKDLVFAIPDEPQLSDFKTLFDFRFSTGEMK